MSRLAIIAGTGAGFYPVAAQAEIASETRWGQPSAPLLRWEQSGHEVFLLRRHGVDGNIPPHRVNYRANIAALAEQGVDAVVATNAVGGIHATATPGQVVIPDQLIDYTWGRAHSFFDSPDDIPAYVDFTHPYDPWLRGQLAAAAAAVGCNCLVGGVYAATQGPRLETAAEIDRLERDGCTVVGMTSMPEAALARESGLAYASCCSVVNFAAGRSDAPIHAEIDAFLQQGIEQTVALVGQLLATFQVPSTD